jgi:alkylated DNA repair dioxygenase AlkB
MEQLDLFSVPSKKISRPQPHPENEIASDAIRGLRYIQDYINEDEHEVLLAQIDKNNWIKDLKRRVQHYGFMYDYKSRRVSHTMRVGPLPPWLQELAEKLQTDGYMSKVADQVIVNEYEPGQGISSHIDCEPCFERIVVSLSLGSDCVMDFTNKFDKTKMSVWLARRSIIILSDEARYKWLHGIAPRKSDEWDGQKYYRRRRISLTFRSVILG